MAEPPALKDPSSFIDNLRNYFYASNSSSASSKTQPTLSTPEPTPVVLDTSQVPSNLSPLRPETRTWKGKEDSGLEECAPKKVKPNTWDKYKPVVKSPLTQNETSSVDPATSKNKSNEPIYDGIPEDKDPVGRLEKQVKALTVTTGNLSEAINAIERVQKKLAAELAEKVAALQVSNGSTSSTGNEASDSQVPRDSLAVSPDSGKYRSILLTFDDIIPPFLVDEIIAAYYAHYPHLRPSEPLPSPQITPAANPSKTPTVSPLRQQFPAPPSFPLASFPPKQAPTSSTTKDFSTFGQWAPVPPKVELPEAELVAENAHLKDCIAAADAILDYREPNVSRPTIKRTKNSGTTPNFMEEAENSNVWVALRLGRMMQGHGRVGRAQEPFQEEMLNDLRTIVRDTVLDGKAGEKKVEWAEGFADEIVETILRGR